MKLSRATAACGALASIVALVIACAVASPARAAAPTNFRATLTATVTDAGGNCCLSFNSFEGNGVLPKLGKVTFSGSLTQFGTPGQTQPCFLAFLGESPCFWELIIEVTAANGRQLQIVSDVSWTPPALPTLAWTATGDFTGSGTYDLTPLFATSVEIGARFTIALTGTLMRT